MKTSLLLFLVAVGCSPSTEEQDLSWVAPLTEEVIGVGEPIELAVATTHPDARAITFTVDGVELAVCDPALADEDCKREDVFRWTTVFDAPGSHTLAASFLRSDGTEIEATRTLTVVTEVPPELGDSLDNLSDLAGLADPELDAVAPSSIAEAASRGTLDPDRGFHSVFGGIAWAVKSQRVHLHSGIPTGSKSAVAACMSRYGTSIRKHADAHKISRASVVATAITESNCTNPAGSSDGLSSGPMQVTGSTCAAITGLSRATCKSRMHSSPDFSFSVGVRYMASAYQVRQHQHDPPKIAAAYNAGSIRRSSANRWHMLVTGNHIDRFVAAYNAYRSWE